MLHTGTKFTLDSHDSTFPDLSNVFCSGGFAHWALSIGTTRAVLEGNPNTLTAKAVDATICSTSKNYLIFEVIVPWGAIVKVNTLLEMNFSVVHARQ